MRGGLVRLRAFVPLGRQRQFSLGSNPALAVHEAVQSFGALGQRIEVALQHLCEGVEHRPRIAWFELVVVRCAPLMHDVHDMSFGTSTREHPANDEVIRLHIGKLAFLVSVETLLLEVPMVSKFAQRAGNNLREVAHDMARVLAGELYFSHEREVIANKNVCTKHQRSRETLVVRVAHAHDATIFGGTLLPQTEQAEITPAIMRERV